MMLIPTGQGPMRRVSITPASGERYDALHVVEGDALILFDPHVPCHDADLIEEACERALDQRVCQVVIGGDLLHFSQYRPRTGLGRQHERRAQDDLRDAGRLLAELRSVFGRVTVIVGNHDRWGIDAQGGQVEGDVWLSAMTGARELDGVTIYAREYLVLVADSERYLIAHGSGGRSSNPLALPMSLAERYQMHVLVGHLHRSAQGYSRCGRYTVASIGCAADTRRFEYQHLRPSALPAQQQGYAIIAGGELSLFSRPAEGDQPVVVDPRR